MPRLNTHLLEAKLTGKKSGCTFQPPKQIKYSVRTWDKGEKHSALTGKIKTQKEFCFYTMEALVFETKLTRETNFNYAIETFVFFYSGKVHITQNLLHDQFTVYKSVAKYIYNLQPSSLFSSRTFLSPKGNPMSIKLSPPFTPLPSVGHC